MTRLNATARATLREAGITQAAWARANYSPDGKWRGDQCGCPDDRCANGFHHFGADDCGCLPVLIEQYFEWLRGADSVMFDDTAYEYVNRIVIEDRRTPPPPELSGLAIAAILRDYAGLFVAISGTEVVASGTDFGDLRKVLRDKGVSYNVVLRVPDHRPDHKPQED